MTYEEAFLWGKGRLNSVEIEEASLDAMILLEEAFDIRKAWYFAHKEETVKESAIKRYKAYIERRAQRVPLQHILGVQEFMGYPFLVNEEVLIPRSDTECLVEVIEGKKHLLNDVENNGILDVCTGSGCILLTLLSRSFCKTGVGLDISEKAIKVAKENAKNLKVDTRATFICSDLFDKVEEQFSIVVSNPPYISSLEIEKLEPEVKDFEPRIALDGMVDGLHFYKRIVAECPKVLKEGGWLFFEIGMEQAEDVSEIMRNGDFSNIEVHKDLSGKDRVVLGRRIKGEENV